ncbi:hypothetical protein [Streptomyces spinosus]|uniref:hypothetical protein n=1 Tax=Streptomyces spinosus TaxID=2872623 RepID=UPI001CEC536A|nr:hypothetical protein [Streptomyces spinosus]
MPAAKPCAGQRRQRDCNQAGARQRLHEALPAELNAERELEWSWCVAACSHVGRGRGASRARRAGSAAYGWRVVADQLRAPV